MTEVKFCDTFLHVNVLCVKHYLDYILAGIGSSLFLFSNESLLLSKVVFVGERIHSIFIKDNNILLKGGKQLSLLKLKEYAGEFCFDIISKVEISDWIQDVIIIENQLAGLVTAHNFFECWDLELKKQISTCFSEEKCILYSCKIMGDSLNDIIVFAGTVFGDVLIWAPFLKEKSMLQRLKAHNGAVFSIDVNQKILTTTSDDRSLKIWSIISPHTTFHHNDWKNSTIQLSHTLFGHTARVWRSLILSTYYLTIGEDSQLIVWSSDGRMIRTLHLHQQSGIRALDYSCEKNIITTGGEDGGINAFSLKYLISENKPLKILNLGHNVLSKVCFIKSAFVYTLKGCCIMVSDAGEEVVYKNDNFLTYCILEVSFGGEYIIMGSIKGHLVIIDSNVKAVEVEEQILSGRIYSIHWLGPFLLTCGPEGRLDLWKLSSEGLKTIGRMTLPHCKERWTTCGTIHNENLILGDRLGNIHIYEIHGGENPVKSFCKIHSYLGVTDVLALEGNSLSVGRDGTIKEFINGLNHSVTYKLPFEWLWKIVRYKNDILILGFHSVSFIVWSKNEREVIASHDCGGGHRSCDYKLHNNKLSFLYIKEKKVFIIDLILDGIIRVRNGFHGKEINCLKVLQNNPTVIVTGSEDTTLRICILEKSELRQVEVLKTHISSIRAICTCTNETKIIILSVGGKGQIVVWEFDLNTLKCQELVNYRLRKKSYNWKSSVLVMDPETRIMCIDMLKVGNELLIVTGCSDCQIRIFSFNGTLNQLCVNPYTHCLLNIAILEVNSMKILVSMGTDGKVTFWEITESFNINQLERFCLHQSGINSFNFQEVGCGNFILATGGDDNLISVSVVEIVGRKVCLRQVWESRTTHSCQITGIKILKQFLITTSIDQRITIWKWFWQENEFRTEFLNQCMSSVPDIQGMEAEWLNSSTILVCLYGKGMEILKVDISSSSPEVS